MTHTQYIFFQELDIEELDIGVDDVPPVPVSGPKSGRGAFARAKLLRVRNEQ